MSASLDPLFRVELIAATPNPQQVIYGAMHQDYSEGFVYDSRDSWPDEQKAGKICVKRLLAGGRGHYGCYSEDTEVLTDQGWVYWPQVTTNHSLAAVNIEDGTIRFEKPTALQVVPFEKEDRLYEVKSQKINFAVTLDHRMVVSKRRRGNGGWSKWSVRSAHLGVGRPARYMLGGNLEERKIPEDLPSAVNTVSLFKLAGFYFAHGSKMASFTLSSVDYLKGLGVKVKEKGDGRYVIGDEEVGMWITKHFSNSIPAFIMQLPKAMFEAFVSGFGVRRKNGRLSFNSVNRPALDILQAGFHLNGKSATITKGVSKSESLWVLNVSSKKPVADVNGRRKTTETLRPYKGNVYCATVSTGALFVRREGKPVVLGNCLEHTQIVLNAGWFPHSVMQQGRTHRIGCSWDVQCVAGDTKVTLLQSNGVKTYTTTIEKLFKRWEKDPEAVRKVKVRSLDEEKNVYTINHIDAVVRSGVKPVFKVILEDGKVIRCTKEHRILSVKGWNELGNLTVGDKVIADCKGSSEPRLINSIEEDGECMTYDIAMKAPHHNFVANGIVVHNSMRYTGDRICRAAKGELDLEEVFYLRPVGNYSDRQGKKYTYTEEQRRIDLELCRSAALRYEELILAGYAEEHARGILPFDTRQHFVVSFSLRSLLHFMDLRAKLDAQEEIRVLCDMMWPHAKKWVPEIAAWYEKDRLHKARLAP